MDVALDERYAGAYRLDAPLLASLRSKVLCKEHGWWNAPLEEEKEFATKKVISLNSYAEEKRGKTIGVAFECICLSEDRKMRSFLMQWSWSGNWVPKGPQAQRS
jgi:hypothetical protein